MERYYKIDCNLITQANDKGFAKLVKKYGIENYCYRVKTGSYIADIRTSGIIDELASYDYTKGKATIFAGYHDSNLHRKEVAKFEKQLRIYLGQ